MQKTKDEFFRSARQFLAQMQEEQEGDPSGVSDIGPTDNLWDQGFIDSMNVIRFLLFLEDWVGREIEVEDDAAQKFRTLEGIYNTYVSDDVAV